MKPTVAFHTLGCRLNQSETASIQSTFEANGYQVVDEQQSPDIVVINTCTVTEGGDNDTRRLVNKINRLNPAVRIALVGCQAQVQKERLADMPNVRWIVGNARKMDLVKVFEEFPDPNAATVVAPVIERDPFTLPVNAIDRHHKRANLKIQDGCDFFCSFCEIPYARGRARSRVFEDILMEAKALVSSGHQELVLTGINIGTYHNEGKSFLDVIASLEDLQGLERIRISSIEPTTIPLEMFNYMQGKLCRYLHIPLQSGHNEILEGMKRKYTLEEFHAFISRAFQQVPHICIGTDVIVGFPGETDAHFDQTVDYLRDAPIHYFHVFSYSPRHMAKSRLLETLPTQIISKRSQILRELSSRKRRLFHETLVGQNARVLCESQKGRDWEGVTDNYVRVFIRSDLNLRNRMVDVRLNQPDHLGMRGDLI